MQHHSTPVSTLHAITELLIENHNPQFTNPRIPTMYGKAEQVWAVWGTLGERTLGPGATDRVYHVQRECRIRLAPRWTVSPCIKSGHKTPLIPCYLRTASCADWVSIVSDQFASRVTLLISHLGGPGTCFFRWVEGEGVIWILGDRVTIGEIWSHFSSWMVTITLPPPSSDNRGL